MKISIMSLWNSPCGVSVHAEQVGREWIRAGHELTVFAPMVKGFRTNPDEPFVIRNYCLLEKCFQEKGISDDFFDPKPFLDNDWDVFVMEHFNEMPVEKLAKIFPQIRKKGPTVLIPHQGKIPEKSLIDLGWDAVICFDERWKKLLTGLFHPKKLHIISYPCHPVEAGDKRLSREKLGLPQDKKIVLLYGISVHKAISLLPSLNRINKKCPLLLVVVTEVADWLEIYSALVKKYKFIDLRQQTMDIKTLYTYLHASDCLIYHTDSSEEITLSSTAHLCLGSCTPILAQTSNFVEMFNKEVIRYSSQTFEGKLMAVFSKSEIVGESLKAARSYASKNSADKISRKFIDLFEYLQGKRK